MKISVVIPVYNGEKWIAQCLDNVLSQSYKDLEVIVVDDGSRDATAAIAAGYPVRLISRANGGVSAARNAGIDAASGDYIHFMDVDDLINLDYYRNMAEAALLTGADMVYGGVIHEATTRLSCSFSEKWVVTTKDDKFWLTDVGTNGCCWRYLISRSLLDKSGLRFEVGLRHMEDTVFSIQAVYMADKIATVPGATYYYKKRTCSAVRDRSRKAKIARKEDRRKGNAIKAELIRKFGLDNSILGLHTVHAYQYRLFGIPVVEKKISNDRIAHWYVLGLRVVQAKQKF